MICQWCHKPIDRADVGRTCPGSAPTHRPDNRHLPFGDPCPCGRAPEEHRPGHVSKGDPCTRCRLPAASHTVRRSANTPKNRAALRERDGWKCQLCGEAFRDPPAKHPDRMSVNVDHIIPAWKKGGEELANLRLTHYRCNMQRGGVESSPAQLLRDQRAAGRWAGRDPSSAIKVLLARSQRRPR